MDVMNAPTKNRIIAVDAIRGFSLFGILVVNILSFHSPHFMYGERNHFMKRWQRMEKRLIAILY